MGTKMPINVKNEYEVVSVSTTYHDLRHLADDKTVLENPHKGWYYHFIDNSCRRPAYRDRLTEGEGLKTRGMHHMYLRIDWGDIELSEGECDWSYIDSVMDTWGALGYKFSLRICTFEGAGVKYATPKWVIDLGIGTTEISIKNSVDTSGISAYEPDYADPLFLEKLEAFILRAGEKFDRDERVEFVDVGTFGTWGEGHTSSGSYKEYTAAVIKKHINIHLKAFPNKTVVVNDDYIHHLYTRSPEEASEIYDYCLGRGLGLRDDSICVASYSQQFGFDTMRHPTIFSEFAKNAPVDIECAHQRSTTEELFKDGLPLIEALHRAHATYAGFHGYEDEWHARSNYLSDYIANRLGYWFFIDGVDVGHPASGTYEMASVRIRNNGYARCYHQYDLRLRLTDGEGREYPLNTYYPDSTRWERETVTEERLRLDYRAVPVGSYHLEIGLFEGEMPIKLALLGKMLTADGYYRLYDVDVESL